MPQHHATNFTAWFALAQAFCLWKLFERNGSVVFMQLDTMIDPLCRFFLFFFSGGSSD
jgi:hypothetical protein